MRSAPFTLQSVVRATGLSAHVLRAWERRYRLVSPTRSPSGQRRYSEEQVQYLLLLKRATQAGYPIGTLAGRSDTEIRRLIKAETSTAFDGDTVDPDERLKNECLKAIRALDPKELDDAMERGLVRLGHQGFLRRVVSRVAEEVGVLWRDGKITAAHEHFFTATARTFLSSYTQQFAPPPDAPVLVVATPVGQHHELGAFMAAVAATHLGWRAIYLGSSLPAAEICAAVVESDARALALSIIYPSDDRKLATELRSIRKQLPNIDIIVGGRATGSYAAVFKAIRARVVEDLAQLGDELDSLRAGAFLDSIPQKGGAGR